MLSDFFTPASGQAMLKNMGGGVVGGSIASTIDRLTPNVKPMYKAGIMAVGAVALGAAGKPAACAALTGVATYIALGQIPIGGGSLQDGWAQDLQGLPSYVPLNDNASLADPTMLAQNAQSAYLLSQAMNQSYMPTYAPQYMQQ